MMNSIKLITRNYRTSNIKYTCKTVKLIRSVILLLREMMSLLKQKLDNILSSETKEYLKLDEKMKKERHNNLKFNNDFSLRYINKNTKKDKERKYPSIFWGVYGISFCSVYAGCWYLFDK